MVIRVIILTLLISALVFFILDSFTIQECKQKNLAVITQVSDIHNYPTMLYTNSTEWVKLRGLEIKMASGDFSEKRACCCSDRSNNKLTYCSNDKHNYYLVSLSVSSWSLKVDEHVEFGLFVNDEKTPYKDTLVINYTKTSTHKPETASAVSNICTFKNGDVISVKVRFNDVLASVRVPRFNIVPDNLKLILSEI